MTPSTSTRDLFSLLGRALLALLFIPSGVGKITGFAGTVQYIASHQLPLPQLAAAAAVLIEVVLGALLLVGWQTRWVAVVFIVYDIVLAFVFHAYWSDPPARAMGDRVNFYKDLGLAGAFCFLLAWGPGGWSVDGRRGGVPPPQ